MRLTLVDWVQIASAVGAVAAAVAGWTAARAARDSADTAAQQLPELKRQVEIGNSQVQAAFEQVELARGSAEHAASTAREASRARVDERSPRVVAFLEPAMWPPVVDPERRWMPGGGELRLLDPISVERAFEPEPGQAFVFDREKDWLMWFRVRGVLVNEGASSARVRLPGESRFIAAKSPLLQGVEVAVPPPVGPPLNAEHLLRPGESAVFEWAIGHTLGEWASAVQDPHPPNPNGACFGEIVIFDSFEDGIMDHIHVMVAGRPLLPVDGAVGQWRVAQDHDEAGMAGVVYPTRRTYRSEGWDADRPLPWMETYGDRLGGS